MILAGSLLAMTLAGAAPGDALAEAERQYAQRGLGSRGGIADPRPIQAAIVAYREALRAAPDSIPAQVGLMRALFFRGGFCGEDAATRKKTFAESKAVAEAAMRGGSGALGGRPGAVALYFWAGVSWGQWCLDHKLAAALQGAAGRIRDYAEAAIALDPGYEQGSPHLLLGRLHADSPKVPLVTGFISRPKALENLRRALAISPHNTATQFFLAEAILEHEPTSRAEAIALLTACAAQEPRAEFLVEDAHYRELSSTRLSVLAPRP